MSDVLEELDVATADTPGVQLADRITQDLLAAGAQPGTVIASEPELMSRHEAGRPVFRQAVRILEERGVAFMRRGQGGGLVVAEPSADFAGRSLSIIIESLTADLQPLSILPMAVDNHLFVHGSRRLTLEKCAELRATVRRLERLTPEEFLRAGAHRQLHRAIRTASGEPAVELAHRTATEYGMDLIPYSLNVLAESAKGESWRITCDTAEALIAGDIPAMFECRRKQIEAMRESWPGWKAIERDPQLAPKVNDPSRPEFQLASSQAERLSREILREIRILGWKAGERIGGGAELMQRYGASSNILRQAVRMLQEHSAVEVERGRRGGMYVAVPDRAQAVGRAKAFMSRSGARSDDIRAFLANLALQVLDEDIPGLGAAVASAVGASPTLTFAGVVQAIAGAARSPALELFAEILTPFLPSQVAPWNSPPAVAQALTSGDCSQCRRALLVLFDQASGLAK